MTRPSNVHFAESSEQYDQIDIDWPADRVRLLIEPSCPIDEEEWDRPAGLQQAARGHLGLRIEVAGYHAGRSVGRDPMQGMSECEVPLVHQNKNEDDGQ